MAIRNDDIERIFSEVADMLDIKGENQFRIRSYRNAARTVGSLSRNVVDMVKEQQDLTKLPGIGKDLAGKIRQICQTGRLDLLEQLKQEMPDELLAIMDIPGLGPKRVKTIYNELDINNPEDLKKAAQEHRISKLPGFGNKIEKNILEGIAQIETSAGQGRIALAFAERIIEPLCEYLAAGQGVFEVVQAGSYRRRMETVGDADILVTCRDGADVMDRFVGYEDVVDVIAKGHTKSSAVLRGGLQVDLRVVPQESYGAALIYFTGSKEHNVAIRKIAVEKGLKINEYGIFRGKRSIAGRTEKDVYRKIDLPYIEPELRENRGEIEAGLTGRLPKLVSMDDIRGDLHIHTKWSDGRYSIEQMAERAKQIGYDYIGIADHTQAVAVAGGLKPERLLEQLDEIGRIRKKVKGITILKGSEVDILGDGRLDLPDEVLARLDFTVCSIHSQFGLSQNEQTQRIIRAMDNRYFNIFAHPTGRRLGQREPYALDMERVMKAAKQRGIILELNANPDRLDLNDIHCRMAKELGVKVIINTDAHQLDDLDYMRFGLYQARRGWLEAVDVVNTRKIGDLRKLITRKK